MKAHMYMSYKDDYSEEKKVYNVRTRRQKDDRKPSSKADFEYTGSIDDHANRFLHKETFAGVLHELDNDRNVGVMRPIVFIIKNIKSFNPIVLNDLIHLLKKYRESQNRNFCLVLGVQNNNKDEVHLRINIQNCTNLTMKTFYFPSMKNIIFEVINIMLLTKE